MVISSRSDSGGSDTRPLPIQPTRADETVSRREPRVGPIRLADRYVVGDVLGHGSLGTTHRAFDQLTQRSVAVKLLAERYVDDTTFVQRFMAAAASAGRLHHPHIVAVLDSGLLEGRPFVVMELVDGQSLRPLLASRGRLSIAQCATIAQSVADALVYAHQHQVVHGDLRPENVLLDDRGVVRVADFGLLQTAVTSDATLFGSNALQRAAYSPPELLLLGTIDERTDIYGFGALMYELLIGTTPLVGANVLTGLSHRQPPTPPRWLRPEVPARLDAAVVSALAPEPNERFGSARELRLALGDQQASPALTQEVASPVWRGGVHSRRQRGSRGVSHHVTALVPILVSLTVILGAVGAFTVVFPRLFAGFQTIDVPSLLDHDLGEATAIASAHGLTAKIAATQPTDDRPKDTVLGQDPPVGGRLRRGSEIKLTLSSGMRPPNVIGKSLEEARAILTRAGWPIAGVESQPTAIAPAGTVVASRPGPDETADDRKRGAILLVSSGNLAVRRPTTLASGAQAAPEMVDGNVDTLGKLAAPAPTWVEIELSGSSTVAAVELVTQQDEPGITIHEVWLWKTDNQFRGMHTFAGPTADHQTLSIRFDEPVRDVRAIRIATTQAPGEVGWREIRVFPQ